MPELDPEVFRQARARIASAVHHTPLLGSRSLAERIGVPVALKGEHLQRTGSFKVRGALNHVLQLEGEARPRGVVTVSAGNHAQALAFAAARAGLPCTVVMPSHASRAKADASRGYGAEVILHGKVGEAFQKARELADERGLAFVHPFNDPHIVAGQGTVALEILEDLPDVGAVVVPIGGGGLISGVAAAIAQSAPGVPIYGVEPVGAAVMRLSLDRGAPQRLEKIDTIADGLSAPMSEPLTFELVRRYVEDVVLVTDAEIAAAMAFLLTRTKQLVEAAGAAGVAALLAGKIPRPSSGPVVVILSGGNIDVDRLPGIFALVE